MFAKPGPLICGFESDRHNVVLSDYNVASNMSAKTLRPWNQPCGCAADPYRIEAADGGCTPSPRQPLGRRAVCGCEMGLWERHTT